MVLSIPPASTWSRVRHTEPAGQKPARNRKQPLGPEFDVRFAEQGLCCTERDIPARMVFHEDFGGRFSHGTNVNLDHA